MKWKGSYDTMHSNEDGLSRPVRRGDYLILATGAMGTAQEAYPAGYTGLVSLTIDGQLMTELAASLTLPEMKVHSGGDDSEVFEQSHSASDSAIREPGHRMQD
ncbi:MAG: hypothetical protein ABI182_05990 [Candidatus Baltobacteraceae bacterium]